MASRIPAIACVVVAFALVLAGCGQAATTATPAPSSSPSAPPASTPALTPSASPSMDPSAALETAVRAYSKACLSGDAKAAYLLRSKPAQKLMSYAAFKAAITQIAATYGDASMTSLRVVSLSGSKARVTYRYDIGEIDQVREPWVLERGEWRCAQ